MFVGQGANQLCVDADPIALPHDRSLDNGIHSKRSSNLWDGELCIFEAHHGGAGNDAQIMDTGKASDEGLGHAISKVFLRWISRKVFQRQYCQGSDGRLLAALNATAVQHNPDSQQRKERCHARHYLEACRGRSLFWGAKRRSRKQLALRWKWLHL